MHCDLNSDSIFADGGAGVGGPVIHAAQIGVRLSIGIEANVERYKVRTPYYH
jgi:hypothetical protein